MVSFADVKPYLVNEAKFLGSTFLLTVAGGITGAVVGWVISLFSGVPVLSAAVVEPAFVSLAPLGALAGFATSFIRRMLA
jgi:hypothetical protein